MKFDCSTATLIHLPIFYGCPLVTKVGLGNCDKLCHNLKYLLSGPLQKTLASLCIRVNCDKTMWIVEEKLFWLILMLAINGKEDFYSRLATRGVRRQTFIFMFFLVGPEN